MVQTILSRQKNVLSSCDLLALPGVGAFAKGMTELKKYNLDNWLREEWVGSGKPLLGICLGMQMMFESSEEFGVNKGLGVLEM